MAEYVAPRPPLVDEPFLWQVVDKVLATSSPEKPDHELVQICLERLPPSPESDEVAASREAIAYLVRQWDRSESEEDRMARYFRAEWSLLDSIDEKGNALFRAFWHTLEQFDSKIASGEKKLSQAEIIVRRRQLREAAKKLSNGDGRRFCGNTRPPAGVRLQMPRRTRSVQLVTEEAEPPPF